MKAESKPELDKISRYMDQSIDITLQMYKLAEDFFENEMCGLISFEYLI